MNNFDKHASRSHSVGSAESFEHDRLYQFWSRSQGLWMSKLAKVTLCLLDERELQAFSQIHHNFNWIYTHDSSHFDRRTEPTAC
jgi:hypothetical protein